MNRKHIAAMLVCTLIVGCGRQPDIPIVVTADIQKGIEDHIAEQTRLGSGFYKIDYEGQQLNLKLVKVHKEYLANLGPQNYFACIDLATQDGDVYDVDFFLTGDPGSMKVTETTIHKLNGIPFYAWQQQPDKTWHRIPIEDATPELLGVISKDDKFEFIYRATLPEITETARMWIPIPTSDKYQTVEAVSINVPGRQHIIYDKEHGNKVLFTELDPEDSNKTAELIFSVERIEKKVYPANGENVDKFLDPENLVPDDIRFKKIAKKVVAGKSGDLVKARALYDHVIERMRYAKFGTGWGQGNAVFACDAKRGNCTDYHSYFIALSRSVGIPARFAIGASIPSARNEGGVDGYHCWAEFYTDDRWWPVDISEADKCTQLSTYFFGHHPANRIELSKGRDLILEPGPKSGPINFLAYPVLEVDGKPSRTIIEFMFNRKYYGEQKHQ